MTFLDLVRKVGALTRDRCHSDCDLGLHRQEAARHLGMLLENPYLIRELAAIAQPAAPADDTAEVLAGLRKEMQALADEWGRTLKLDHAASTMDHAIALVEAAQARVVDRGRGEE